MAKVLTSALAREYIGERLNRRAPISEETWRKYRALGLPTADLGRDLITTDEAIEEWLCRMFNACVAKGKEFPVPSPRRPRGRPRKHPQVA